ncbi:MAG: PocR ligand-binding domain-containing protein [Bacteroidales bacterium]|nr:PocR ligand-binding domain-containing protein [Bacteroidales bacterium]
MLIESDIEVLCPNCGSKIGTKSKSIVKCVNPLCDYFIKLFNQDNEEEANDFYLLTPSKLIKHKFKVADNYIAVAYCESTSQFEADNIFNFIEPEALQIIQVGLSEKLKIPMSIYILFKDIKNSEIFKNKVDILTTADGVFGRINPFHKDAYHCLWCKTIRNSVIGEHYCTQYDCLVTNKTFNLPNPVSTWGPCWSGLVDFAIPIVINNLVVAVFTCGQIKVGQKEYDEILYNKCKKVSEELRIPHDELSETLNSNTQYKANNEAEIISMLKSYEDQVKIISTIVENRYWAERNLSESSFLTELYSSFAILEDSTKIWKVVEMVLNRINEYAHFNYSAIFISAKRNNVFDLKGKSLKIENVIRQIELDEQLVNKLFKTEKLFLIKDQYATVYPKLFQTVLEFLKIRTANSMLMFTFRYDDTHLGFIIYADRTGSQGQNNSGVITDKRKSFMEEASREIRMEVYNALNKAKLKNTIISLNRQKEKIEKAEKIREHETKAPLASIQANAFFVLNNINEPSATSKERRLKEIISDAEICSFLFKEIRIPTKEEFNNNLISISPGNIIDEVTKFIKREIERKSKLFIQELPNQIEYDYNISSRINIIQIGSTSRTAVHPYLLKRAFYNLSINAVKYSAAKNGELRIQLSEKGTNICILFEDNGIGINEEDVPFIFNMGFRGENVRSKYNGEGMGLNIAKEIIEAHSGTLKLRNNRNPTIFEILLPHQTISKTYSTIDHNILRNDTFKKH